MSLPTKMPHCTYCDAVGHSKFNCGAAKLAKARLDHTIKTSKKKPMRVHGKYYRTWNRKRASWKKNNPPDHQGYYKCYLCGKSVLAEEMQLDHVISRSRAPELRYDPDNLKPSCHSCNQAKGSLSLDEYYAKLNTSKEP